MLKMKPLADRVIIEPTPAEEKSAGGIIIPDTAKEKPKTGKVVAFGKGKWDNGVLIPMTVGHQDIVIFGQYAGTEVTEDGKEYLIMREDDILAIV